MAGKQRILSGQADRPDGVFDRVGVEFEAAVIEEAREPVPMSEAITDVFGQLGARGEYQKHFSAEEADALAVRLLQCVVIQRAHIEAHGGVLSRMAH